MNASFSFQDVDSALEALAERFNPVGESERCDLPVGRILAEAITADRDSPAADVSAMDGYAIRLSDLQTDSDVTISGECKAGMAPPAMVSGQVLRIFTGAIVPPGCEAVVKREDTVESKEHIRFLDVAIRSTVAGSNIRRRGENAAAGSGVISAGTRVSPAVATGLANFGQVRPLVYRPIRVAVLTTGDEVVDPATVQLEPWQLRNSNRAAIVAMLQQQPFVSIQPCQHVADHPDALDQALSAAIRSADAIVMTGGVSKGDYDYVPETIERLGGEIVFHGLPIRPGKPILGAVTDQGAFLLGLPGNPVSTTINCRRFLLPLLRRLAGQIDWRDQPAAVSLSEPPARSVPLHTMLLVRQRAGAAAELLPSKGSGDLVALSQSDGFVCLPPSTATTGPWPYYPW